MSLIAMGNSSDEKEMLCLFTVKEHDFNHGKLWVESMPQKLHYPLLMTNKQDFLT